MHTQIDYNVGMKRRHPEKTVQLTIRGVPTRIKKLLQDRAQLENKSLNTVLLEAITTIAGDGSGIVYHDLDGIAGTWVDDPEFDKIIEEQNQIDPSMWQ